MNQRMFDRVEMSALTQSGHLIFYAGTASAAGTRFT